MGMSACRPISQRISPAGLSAALAATPTGCRLPHPETKFQVRQLKPADLLRQRPSEGSALITEQFAFQQAQSESQHSSIQRKCHPSWCAACAHVDRVRQRPFALSIETRRIHDEHLHRFAAQPSIVSSRISPSAWRARSARLCASIGRSPGASPRMRRRPADLARYRACRPARRRPRDRANAKTTPPGTSCAGIGVAAADAARSRYGRDLGQ